MDVEINLEEHAQPMTREKTLREMWKPVVKEGHYVVRKIQIGAKKTLS